MPIPVEASEDSYDILATDLGLPQHINAESLALGFWDNIVYVWTPT